MPSVRDAGCTVAYDSDSEFLTLLHNLQIEVQTQCSKAVSNTPRDPTEMNRSDTALQAEQHAQRRRGRKPCT